MTTKKELEEVLRDIEHLASIDKQLVSLQSANETLEYFTVSSASMQSMFFSKEELASIIERILFNKRNVLAQSLINKGIEDIRIYDESYLLYSKEE